MVDQILILLVHFLLERILILLQVEQVRLRSVLGLSSTECSHHAVHTIFLLEFLEFVILDLYACAVIHVCFGFSQSSNVYVSELLVVEFSFALLEYLHYT